MKTVFVYEIYLDEMLVANSGEKYFETENKAFEDANFYIEHIIEHNFFYLDCTADEFDINVSEIDIDDFRKGW